MLSFSSVGKVSERKISIDLRFFSKSERSYISEFFFVRKCMECKRVLYSETLQSNGVFHVLVKGEGFSENAAEFGFLNRILGRDSAGIEKNLLFKSVYFSRCKINNREVYVSKPFLS